MYLGAVLLGLTALVLTAIFTPLFAVMLLVSATVYTIAGTAAISTVTC